MDAIDATEEVLLKVLYSSYTIEQRLFRTGLMEGP